MINSRICAEIKTAKRKTPSSLIITPQIMRAREGDLAASGVQASPEALVKHLACRNSTEGAR